MASIINIKLAEPTKTHPFKFFDTFFAPGILQRVRENFFNALRPSEDGMSYLFSDNKEGDYIEIEYSEEDFDPENPSETHKRWDVIKRYHFKEELIEYLKAEFYKSKELCGIRMAGDLRKDNKMGFVANEVKKIDRYIDFIEQDESCKMYPNECKRPLYAIVRMIYNLYPIYAPLAEKRIADILKNTSEVAIDYTPDSLRISLVNALLNLTDENDDLVFFGERELTEISTLNEQLRYFITGEFSKIVSPINFSKNIEAAHYLISRIAKINRFKLADIETKNIITTNGTGFKAGTCSKGKGAFISKNATLRKEIDLLLKVHAG